MPLQLTVVPDRPVQTVLDVRDKRKPQQTASPVIIHITEYTVEIQSIVLLRFLSIVLDELSQQKMIIVIQK